jgi:hypothetical protein
MLVFNNMILQESPLATLKSKASSISSKVNDAFTQKMMDSPKLARALGTTVRTAGHVIDYATPSGLIPGGVSSHASNYDQLYGHGMHPKSVEDSSSMNFGQKLKDKLSPQAVDRVAKASAASEGLIRGTAPILTPLSDKIRRFRAGITGDQSIIHSPEGSFHIGKQFPSILRVVQGAF